MVTSLQSLDGGDVNPVAYTTEHSNVLAVTQVHGIFPQFATPGQKILRGGQGACRRKQFVVMSEQSEDRNVSEANFILDSFMRTGLLRCTGVPPIRSCTLCRTRTIRCTRRGFKKRRSGYVPAFDTIMAEGKQCL